MIMGGGVFQNHSHLRRALVVGAGTHTSEFTWGKMLHGLVPVYLIHGLFGKTSNDLREKKIFKFLQALDTREIVIIRSETIMQF